MKIAILLAQRLGATGSGTFTANLASGLAMQGHTVRVGAIGIQEKLPVTAELQVIDFSNIFPDGHPGMADTMPYKSIRFSHMSDADLDRYFRRLCEIVEDMAQGADLLHVNHYWVAAAAASRAWRGPLVITVHGTDLSQFRKCPSITSQFRLGELSNKCRVHFPSTALMARAHELEIRPQRSKVIPLPIKEDLFFPPSFPSIRSGSVCIGKISDEKGIHELGRAFSQLNREYPDHVLHLIGGAPDVALRCFFPEKLVNEGKVKCWGVLTQAEVATICRQSRILVCPSWSEGYSLVCAEGAASGMKVVMPRFGAVDEQLTKIMRPRNLHLYSPLQSVNSAERASFSARLAAAWLAAERSLDEPTGTDELEIFGRGPFAKQMVDELYNPHPMSFIAESLV